MNAYVMDAFAKRVFGGNQAGVVLPERSLSDEQMRQIAAEFKHSETVFAHFEADGAVRLKYFTPTEEVDLCGHATVGAFALLRKLGRIGDGEQRALTRSGALRVTVQGETVWMDMAPPELVRYLTEEESAALYRAYGLTVADGVEALPPAIVSTGLPDVMLAVRDRETLLRAVQDAPTVAAWCRARDCVGVHMFCPGDGDVTAWCSNFAPRCGIPEECATGTANGALTYYLYKNGRLAPESENRFIQGEHMARPSEIRSVLHQTAEGVSVRIGGCAVMSMACELFL